MTMLQRRRLIYVILAFCAVVLVGLVLLIDGRSGSRKDSSQNPPSLPGTTPQELRFRRIAIFDGKTKEGARFATFVYKSSDCLSIVTTTTFFESSSRASKEVRRETEKAPVVVERGPKLDEKGQRVGERVVMELRANDQNKESVQIIWNSGSDFSSIAGPSMRHVVELEKSLQAINSDRISEQSDIQSLTFNPGRTSTGHTEAGVSYFEQQFDTSDCEKIVTRTIHFGSPDQAEEELKKELSRATNVVEQGPKVNASGERVGERAVAMLFAARDEPIDQTIVAWTEGADFHSIIGPNEKVLEFEKRNHK